jgi:ATP/maltotriose-dependent transcriptional regulator MalT
MSAMFERGELLSEVKRSLAGPPLLLAGPPGSGKTTLLHAVVDTLKTEGWQPVYLDLLAAATSPERFVQSALGALPEGLDGRAAARAREADQLSRSGRREGGRAVLSLLSAWAALDTVDGRPIALVLDGPPRSARWRTSRACAGGCAVRRGLVPRPRGRCSPLVPRRGP